MENTEFKPWPKTNRLFRDVIISEKIDGTHANILITEDGDVFAGSRTRWITPQDDNYGFAAWVEGNKQEVLKLGPGRHFGEWWGSGINRNYGMTKGARFMSLFNTVRWAQYGSTPISTLKGDGTTHTQEIAPELFLVVPELYRGPFSTGNVVDCIRHLKLNGSVIAPGFMNPEGVITFHTAGNIGFKTTIEKDEEPKGGWKNGTKESTKTI